MRVTLNDVVSALQQLGGEAQSYQIKDRITKNFGGVPEHYKNETSFRETIQVIIQEHTPEEKKYWSGNPAVFRKISRGRFKIRENYSPNSNLPIVNKNNTVTKIENLINDFEISNEFQNSFNVNSLEDAREKTIGTIVKRRGQKIFREKLLKVYNFRCAVTGCNVIQALEASHIIPFLGEETNHIKNGIILRADIHTLFDLRLLAINENDYTLLLSSKLKDSNYSKYMNTKIHLPNNVNFYPSKEALKKHRIESSL